MLLPLNLPGSYDYLVPAEADEPLVIEDGAFVEVPLGSRRVAGVVWGGGGEAVAAEKLKPILARFEAPALSAEMRRFVDWVAAYTVHPPGAVLRMVMSVPEALRPPRPGTAYALASSGDGVRMTPARERVLAVLADGASARGERAGPRGRCRHRGDQGARRCGRPGPRGGDARSRRRQAARPTRRRGA